MVREYTEETGVTFLKWDRYATVQGETFIVHFFRGFGNEVYNVRTVETEEVCIVRSNQISIVDNVIPNLKVLIPLALDVSGIMTPVHFRDSK